MYNDLKQYKLLQNVLDYFLEVFTCSVISFFCWLGSMMSDFSFLFNTGESLSSLVWERKWVKISYFKTCMQEKPNIRKCIKGIFFICRRQYNMRKAILLLQSSRTIYRSIQHLQWTRWTVTTLWGWRKPRQTRGEHTNNTKSTQTTPQGLNILSGNKLDVRGGMVYSLF